MCSSARCTRCGKTTWQGCGRHVDAVMAAVPAAQRCRCEAAPAAPVAARRSPFALLRRR